MPSSTELTPEQKYEILKFVTEESVSPVGTKSIEKDAQTLIKRTRDISTVFQDITVTLTIIDTAEGKDGNPLNNTGSKFAPTWKILSGEFENLINRSTTVATQLGVACTTFEEVLLPVLTDKDPENPMTLDEKRSTINSFLEATNDSAGNETKGLKKSVEEFHAKLKTFAENFSSFADTRLAIEPTQTSKLNAELNLAIKAIEGLKNQIAAWMVSSSLALLASLSWGLFPGFVFFAGVAGVRQVLEESVIIDNYEYMEQIYHWQAFKDESATKIAELAKKEPSIQKCEEDLVTIRGSTIPEVCAAMGSFEDVWQNIKSQWESIALVLKDTHGDLKVKNEPTCKAYIETNEAIYGPIGREMVKYGELQASTNGGVLEKQVSTSLLAWGNIHPIVEKKVGGVFKSLNVPMAG